MVEMDFHSTMGLHLAVEQEVDEAIHFMIILLHTDLDILDSDGYIVNGEYSSFVYRREARPRHLDIES